MIAKLSSPFRYQNLLVVGLPHLLDGVPLAGVGGVLGGGERLRCRLVGVRLRRGAAIGPVGALSGIGGRFPIGARLGRRGPVGGPGIALAVLALTAVRMIPVAVALTGTGLDRTTKAFVGWFGPRGLASVVFTLIAVDTLNEADGNRVLSTVGLTIALSVIAHGVTAGPFAARYGASRST